MWEVGCHLLWVIRAGDLFALAPTIRGGRRRPSPPLFFFFFFLYISISIWFLFARWVFVCVCVVFNLQLSCSTCDACLLFSLGLANTTSNWNLLFLFKRQLIWWRDVCFFSFVFISFHHLWDCPVLALWHLGARWTACKASSSSWWWKKKESN